MQLLKIILRRHSLRTSLERYAALACVLLFGSCSQSNTAIEQRVVLITLDTLRLDSLQNHMPRLAARAEKSGVIFERYLSATPITLPTHATLLTGLEPWRHSAPKNGAELQPSFETLAESLKKRGFATAAVVASFPVKSDFGLNQGFDIYRDDFEIGMGGAAKFYSKADAINRRAHELLEEATASQQFFWFHYFDAHEPYGDWVTERLVRPAKMVKEIQADPSRKQALIDEARSLYDTDVQALDRELDQLLSSLLDSEHGTRTHVLIVSDHGESFGEDELLGHGDLVPTQIHVPCLLFSSRAPTSHRDEVIGSIDVHATLRAIADIPALEGQNGRNLLSTELPTRPVAGMRRPFDDAIETPLADGSSRTLEGHQFFLAQGDQVWVGNEQSLSPSDWFGVSGTEQSDPLAESSQAAVQILFASFSKSLSGQDLELHDDPATLEALNKLGYLD